MKFRSHCIFYRDTNNIVCFQLLMKIFEHYFFITFTLSSMKVCTYVEYNRLNIEQFFQSPKFEHFSKHNFVFGNFFFRTRRTLTRRTFEHFTIRTFSLFRINKIIFKNIYIHIETLSYKKIISYNYYRF